LCAEEGGFFLIGRLKVIATCVFEERERMNAAHPTFISEQFTVPELSFMMASAGLATKLSWSKCPVSRFAGKPLGLVTINTR